MDEVDYESLPSTSTLSDHLLAGALAGVMEHVVMYPVDCIKTRMQCIKPLVVAENNTLVGGLYRLFRYEGTARALRGVGVVIGGAAPAHAIYFGCYEYMKVGLQNTYIGSSAICHSLAGACATMLHDAVMTPADAIKQRLQMYNSPYHNSLDCFRRVCRAEGPAVLYRAYFTQLAMNIPYQAVHFVSYEASQNFLNPSHQYAPMSHVLSGGVAGGLAALLTTPLDVCKTVLNTQDECLLKQDKHSVRGLTEAIQLIWRMKGARGFMCGTSARVINAVPGTAISWSVYEYFKWYLARKSSVSPPSSGSGCHPGSLWFSPSGEVACAASRSNHIDRDSST